MLERESFGTGWQASLRPRGAGRIVAAGFLGVWLCGWAAGEYFAGGTLLAALRQLLAPDLELAWLPRMRGSVPANPWPVVAFLAVWLTIWTIGGIAAMTEVARVLAGVDEVRWDHEGIEVVRRAGPFASRRRLAWAEVRGGFSRRRGRLVAHTRRGPATIAALGTAGERDELAALLASAWREARGGEAESRPAFEQAPEGWTVATAEDGRPMLVTDPRARRIGALVLALFALFLGMAGAAVAGSAGGALPWVGAAVFGVLSLACVAGSAWLAFGRVELRPFPGQLRRVRRAFGREWTRELSPARLRLEHGRDSDGDERWNLVALGPDGRQSLATGLNAPGPARHLGLWLAARMQVELENGSEHDEERRRAG